MRKKVLAGLIIISLALFLSKDIWLKLAINHYFNKKLGLESSIGRLRLSFGSLTVEDAEFSNQDFFIQLPYLKVFFGRLELFKPRQLNLVIMGGSIRASNEDFFFEGIFAGDLILALKGFSLTELQGRLINQTGGTIKIKNEGSLKALAGYLDYASYQSLVKGFKNYRYGQAEVNIAKAAESLIIGLKFDSAEFGKRDITVNLHDILH